MLMSWNRDKETKLDLGIINPMLTDDTTITLANSSRTNIKDNEILPPCALRHEMVNEMLGLLVDDDDIPLSKIPPLDPKIQGYSTVLDEGRHLSSFKFTMKRKTIPGQPGAGVDSKLETGAFVRVSFAWQAFTRDQPDQRLCKLHRSI